MDVVPFAGWTRNARLVSGATEVIVTLEVGPRVLFYGFTGGPNQFVVHAKDAGKTGEDVYHSYGGHRLWIAPEEKERTLQPDNEPVEVLEEDGWTLFRARRDRYSVQREIALRAVPEADRFLVGHRITNHSPYALELAPWALSQMAPGGELLIPQAAHVPHGERLLPVRAMSLWGYTDMTDPRWTWGRRVVRLRQTSEPTPQKAGFLIAQGIAAYSNAGTTMVCRFPYEEGATYPDFGVNFETFTRHDMLEVESLGPMQVVAPGGSATHLESWTLLADTTPPNEDEAAAYWLSELASRCPL